MPHDYSESVPNIGIGVAENDHELFKDGMIAIPSYKQMDNDDCIFIVGRKGGGKSQLRINYEKDFQHKFSHIISIKKASLEFISYRTVRRELINKDSIDKLDIDAISSHAWKLFIMINLMIQVCKKDNSSDYRVRKMKNYLTDNNWYSFDNDKNILNFIVNIIQIIIETKVADGALKSFNEFYFHGEGATEAINELQAWLDRQPLPVLIAIDDIDDEVGTIKSEEERENAVSFCNAIINAVNDLTLPRFSKNLAIKVFFPEDLYLGCIGRHGDKRVGRELIVRWSNKDLIDMLCYRLSTNINRSLQKRIKNNRLIWSHFFPSDIGINELGYPSSKKMPSYGFIINYTLKRPRDIILLTKEIFDCVVQSGDMRVHDNHVIEGISRYSAKLLQYIEGEYSSRLPSIEDILGSFTNASRVISRHQLINQLKDYGSANDDKPALEIIEILYEMGFLGVLKEIRESTINPIHPKYQEEFYYDNPNIKIAHHTMYVVNKAFTKALNIYES